MKKKLLAIALIAAMSLTLASCGKDKDKGRNNGGDSSESSVSTSTNTEDDDAEYTPGVHDDSVYKNEFLGIAMPLEGYVPYTEEQIAQLAEQSGSTENTTYDFVAVSSDGSTNVNILFEKLNSVASASDAETILSSQVKSVEQSLSAYNVTATMSETEFCGKTHPVMLVQAEGFTEVMVCIKKGGYAAYITATGNDQAGAQALLDSFYAL